MNAYLTTGVVPQIIPVDLELCMVVHMHELVHHSVLHVAFAHEPVLAQHDDPCRAEPSRSGTITRCADNVVRRHIRAGQLQVVQHEDDCRA